MDRWMDGIKVQILHIFRSEFDPEADDLICACSVFLPSTFKCKENAANTKDNQSLCETLCFFFETAPISLGVTFQLGAGFMLVS